MPESLEDKLVIGISSRALFDLEAADTVFQRKGLSAYRAYQRKHERDILEPGTAYALVRGLLDVNVRAGERLVEVIIFSRNDADTGMRVLRSVEAHGLDITRGVFRGGREPWPLLRPMHCAVFLSAEPSQVLKAREHGVASALILPSAQPSDGDIDEVRIAFDGDAVLFDEESQLVYDSEGLDAFHAHEAMRADEPLLPGPFRPFLEGVARIQAHFGTTSPIRTALVTARGAPAHYRVVNTLRAWGVNVDETYFLGGVDKSAVLKAFGAHIFFDDQLVHAEAAAAQVPAAQVLWREDELPPEARQAVVVMPGRDQPAASRSRKTARKPGTASSPKPRSKPKPTSKARTKTAATDEPKAVSPRAASRPAGPRGQPRSGR